MIVTELVSGPLTLERLVARECRCVSVCTTSVMGGGNGQGGAGADGDLDEALAHVGSGDKASSVVGSWRDSATPTSSEDV